MLVVLNCQCAAKNCRAVCVAGVCLLFFICFNFPPAILLSVCVVFIVVVILARRTFFSLENWR